MIRTLGRATVAAALLAWACLTPGPAFAGKSDDTLVVAFQRSIDNLDRLFTVRREMLILSQLTDDGLFYADPKTLGYVPLAAKSYKYVDDTTLDVVIRDGVKFHNGGTLNADDVVYTYNLVLDKSFKTVQDKRVQRWLKSVTKTGPMSVRFKLKHPYPMALRDMAVSVQLRKKGTYDTKDPKKPNPDSQVAALNSNGPYKVVKFEPGKDVVLERFDGYYKDSPKGRPAIKRIIIRAIPDWGTQQAEIISGGVNWMYDVPSDVAQHIGKLSQVTALNGPSMRVYWISMDAAGYTGKDNPFTKLDVRRAVNYAIDREAIVKNIVKGTSQVINSACNPVQFGCYQDVPKYGYDPAKAKKLLKEAGYPHGFTFDLWAYRERPVAEAIMADLAKVGITAKLRFVTSGALASARKSHEVPTYFASWGSGSTADTSMIVDQHWSLTTDRNLSGDKQVAEWVLAAEATIDPKARAEDYKKALTRIAEKAYWVPLYSGTLDYLVSSDLAFTPPKDGLPRLYLAHWK
jgi:peptide/nickel transport system substrate-binding protein